MNTIINEPITVAILFHKILVLNGKLLFKIFWYYVLMYTNFYVFSFFSDFIFFYWGWDYDYD